MLSSPQRSRSDSFRHPVQFTRRGGLQLGKKVAGSMTTAATLAQHVFMHGRPKLVKIIDDVGRSPPGQGIGRRSSARHWVKESGNEFFEKGAEVYAKA
jgi:hypothetical protein